MKVFHREAFVALCYLVLIKPGCIAGIPALRPIDISLDILRIALIGFILLVFILNGKIQINRLFGIAVLLIISSLWELVSSLLNGVTIGGFGEVLNTLGIILFTFIALSVDYQVYIRATAKVVGSYIIINCLTVLLFPGGMYSTTEYTQNYFLSYRTAWFAVYLLGLTASLLWYAQEKLPYAKRWCVLVIVCAYVSMVIVWTATGLVCFSLAALFLGYCHFTKKQIMGIKTILVSEAVLFYLVIITRLQEVFAWLIVSLLKKDLTLSFRTRIWDNALESIQKHLWIGVGRLENAEMRHILEYGVSHPHNRYLYITMCFGLIGLALFLAVIYLSARGRVKKEVEQQNRVILAALIALLSAGQVESFSATGGYLLPLFLIAAALHRNQLPTGK